MKAEYECLGCGLKFQGFTNPNPDFKSDATAGPHIECKSCGHKYVKWLNYLAMKLVNFK